MSWRADAVEHALRERPREACGLVVLVDGRETYWPCRNVATSDGEFDLHSDDYAAAEDAGQVLAVVHSHPAGPAEASADDQAECTASRLPWVVLVDIERQEWVTLTP